MKNPLSFRTIRQLGCIIFFLLSCSLWGLDPAKGVDQYLIDQWDISDGIPSNTISSIAQTPDGYLWVATLKGLVRFDGLNFHRKAIHPLQTAIPISLYTTREGNLWIGSTEGLTRVDSETGQFRTFTTADGITADGIRCLKQDMRDHLWISFTASYVNRCAGGHFFAYDAAHGLEGNKINAIVEDRSGNLLFGSREKGIFVYKDEKFQPYPVPGLEDVQIITMHEDRNGYLWIGTNKGLFRVRDKSIKNNYTGKDGLSHENITAILEDSERNLWVGTRKGLNRIKEKPDGTIAFERLLEPFLVVCLFEDKEKSLWVGTYKSGIKQVKEGKFITYAPLETYQEEILFSLFEDPRGDTWIGTFSGRLFRCRDKHTVEFVMPPQLSGAGIAALAGDAEGNLWLGTNGKGVFQKKNNTFTRFTTEDGLADNLVTSIFRDSRDNLWFSTFDGLSIRRPQTGTFESFKSRDGLLGKIVHNIYEDQSGNIWIAADKGLTLIKEGNISKEHTRYILRDVSVTCIREDQSGGEKDRVLWIATYGSGLKRLRLKDGALTSYTTAAGMASNILYQVLEDQRNNLWITSDSGILRVNKSELNRFAVGKTDQVNCTSFGISDGLKSTEFDNVLSAHSVLKTRKGELWFVTKKGISIVDPARVRVNKNPPPVVIEAIVIDGRAISMQDKKAIDSFKGVRDVTIKFTAPTFLSPEKVRFKYQLQGVDGDWIYLSPGSEREAGYSEPEPGVYTFRVSACNAEGVWSSSGEAFTFTLKSFFYQTLLFKIALLLLLAAFVTGGIHLYKKRPFTKTEKYKNSSLNAQFAGECIKKLRHLMEVERCYRDADTSLQSLAEKLSISPHILSRILNEKLNRNFADFINSYRIDEAKEILQSPKGARTKISAVAFDVGFNTMVAFYNAFKKYTGKIPAQHKK
ncbi:MAG: helix-turn-helix domain-containing protein [Candidatus Aminicenantes bacterium]|nr:helix-turn-helix domain-containing protein [Candidatus Aminicenantes bacterium]